MITITITILLTVIISYRFYKWGYSVGYSDREFEAKIEKYSRQIDELKAKIEKL